MMEFDKYQPTRLHSTFSIPGCLVVDIWLCTITTVRSRSGGSYRAVNEFLAGKSELLITIPDMWGTVLFSKV
jgi:hypothetical protein